MAMTNVKGAVLGAALALVLAACGGAPASHPIAVAPAPTTASEGLTTEAQTAPTTVAPTTAPATVATEPPTTEAPTPAPTEAPATTVTPAPVVPSVVVTQVIDGDTIVIDTGQHVRFIGIDTPERGQCGYAEATANMRNMVYGKAVVLTAGAREDVDNYGRLLRYVDLRDGTDTGLAQFTGGFAIARYDSDGYGRHDLEEQYVAADTGAAAHCLDNAPTATSGRSSAAGRASATWAISTLTATSSSAIAART
jgi:micrococcal nuclease